MPIAAASTGSDLSGTGASEFMLFGVRVVVDSMKKSVSLNNLWQYEHPQDQDSNVIGNSDVTAVAAGYASADDASPVAAGHRARKRGVPWTEEEHKLFLLGLQKVGKGDWKGIARNFVKSRTPTQVASHAQKYFLRRSNLNRRRRRSSLFDITTDAVFGTPMEEEIESKSYSLAPPLPEASNNNGFPFMTTFTQILAVQTENPVEKLSLGQARLENTTPQKIVRPFAVHPALKESMDPSSALSLRLSLTSDQQLEMSSRHSTFQARSSFNRSDNIISVS